MEISVKAFSKHYGEQKAVDQLTFKARTGEILGFLEPNGAGKSTTMKAITGYFCNQRSGSVGVGNVDVGEHTLEVRKMIGYLPEHNPLYLDMYVREFLDFVGKTHAMSKADRQKRIPEVIEATGLTREAHKRIGALSKATASGGRALSGQSYP
ncbi:MAG: ATP-binding cassette domain-containing protein [Bacteroidia bacterium]